MKKKIDPKRRYFYGTIWFILINFKKKSLQGIGDPSQFFQVMIDQTLITRAQGFPKFPSRCKSKDFEARQWPIEEGFYPLEQALTIKHLLYILNFQSLRLFLSLFVRHLYLEIFRVSMRLSQNGKLKSKFLTLDVKNLSSVMICFQGFTGLALLLLVPLKKFLFMR